MGARMLPAGNDPIRPSEAMPVTITLDGAPVTGIVGQSIAGIVMACDQLELRRTASGHRPRGVFCGIGVCFDCLVEVNGVQDVRACQRKAREGDVVNTHSDTGAHGDVE
ncbi:MAG: (2Fe-2S)-binding protein [Terrimesophilobacter sp.]